MTVRAARRQARAAEMHFTGPLDLLGLPALSVLCSLSGGSPVGSRVVTACRNEAPALSIGAAFEALCPVCAFGDGETYSS